MDPFWCGRVDAILRTKPRLLATSIFDRLVAEGFEGSYPTVVRYVRGVRGPRFRGVAGSSIPIETGPGEEAQVDWSDCTDWAVRWGWDHDLWCLGCILCWSRWRTVWFASSIDRQHTLEGLVGLPEVDVLGIDERMASRSGSMSRAGFGDRHVRCVPVRCG
jgi:hypothetical protein